jgi:hypothetical protein
MNELPDEIDRLTERIEALERDLHALEPRVDALEHPLAARWPRAELRAKAPAAGPAVEARSLAVSGSLFPVLGKSLLGIAGAYVLRALEAASTLPRLAVAVAGIVYAFLWLVSAARTRNVLRVEGAVYACTSTLILAPMLWELTLRFQVFSAALAAGVVCAFGLAAVALASKRASGPVLRISMIAAAGLALALAIASHAMIPFLVVLLILTAACEFVPAFERIVDICAVVALVADAAIWILIFIYFSPQNAHEDYPPLGRAALLAPGVAMLVLFLAAVTLRTVLRAQRITVFEIFQTTIAFLLAAVSLADFAPSSGLLVFGVVCLLLAVVSCAAVLTVFARIEDRRNAAVFAFWGSALFLAGSFLCLPPLATIVLLCAGAIAAAVAGRQRRLLAFEISGIAFLLAAAIASGFPRFVVNALIGTPGGFPAAGVWLIAVCAVLSLAILKSREGEPWGSQMLHLALAALAAAGFVALLVQGLVALVALHVIPGEHHLAFIRTLILCVTALTLVFSGARSHRTEFTRLGYATLTLVTVKLVFEDLRHGHLFYIAASIFFVALTLIAAPRVARVRQKA